MKARKDILKTTDQLYYILESPKAKRWVGLMSIKLDLQYVKQLLEYMKGQEDDELLTKSYWISCIIIYGKCFTDAAKGRGTTLNKEDIFSNLKVLMETKMLNIPNFKKLIFELKDFRYETTPSGNLKLHHSEGGHDDFVDALACACHGLRSRGMSWFFG